MADNNNNNNSMSDPLTGLAVGAGSAVAQGLVNTIFGNEAGHQARKTFRANAGYQNILNRQNAKDKYQLELSAMRNAGISETALGGKMSDAGISPVSVGSHDVGTYAGNIGQNMEKFAEMQNLQADTDLKNSQSALNGQQQAYNEAFFPKNMEFLQSQIEEINANKDLKQAEKDKRIAETFRINSLVSYEVQRMMYDVDYQQAKLEQIGLQNMDQFLSLPANVLHTYLAVGDLVADIQLKDARTQEAIANAKQLGALQQYWHQYARVLKLDADIRQANKQAEILRNSKDLQNQILQLGIDESKLNRLFILRDELAEMDVLSQRLEYVNKLNELVTINKDIAYNMEKSKMWKLYSDSYDKVYEQGFGNVPFKDKFRAIAFVAGTLLSSILPIAGQVFGFVASRGKTTGNFQSVSNFTGSTTSTNTNIGNTPPSREVHRYDDYGNKVIDRYNPVDFPNAKYGHPRSK